VSQPKVFISHTTQDPRDYARAHEIAAELQELSVEVWIAPESIPPGTEWEEQIVRGLLDQCKYFLVLLTPASTRKKLKSPAVIRSAFALGESPGRPHSEWRPRPRR